MVRSTREVKALERHSDDYEYVLCDICNLKAEKVLFDKGELRIVKCKKCGLVYLNPRLKEERNIRFYSETKYIIGERYSEANQSVAIKNSIDRVNDIKKWKKHGKLLDIGSGTGHFLHIAAKNGYVVFGVEPSLNYCEYAKSKFGVNVYPGTLREAKFENDYFDVVTLYHVLEHIASPTAELIEINRVLKKGGLLAIEVPNIDSLKAKFFGKNWSCIVAQHLYYFSPKTLKKILTKTNFHFQIEEISYAGSGLGMVTCLEKYATKKIVKSYVKHLDPIMKIYNFALKFMRIDEGVRVYATKI